MAENPIIYNEIPIDKNVNGYFNNKSDAGG